jgi:hypothetical protein
MRRPALWSAAALAVALGLFVRANLGPERLIVVSASARRCDVVREGPGWPEPSYRAYHSAASEGELSVGSALDVPADAPPASGRARLINGAAGGLLAIAWAVNVVALVRRPRATPARAGPPDRGTYYLPVG